MEDKLTLNNVAILKEKQVEKHVPKRKGLEGAEERITRMDSFEFLTMVGGGAIVGAALYLVSLFAV